MLTSIITTSVFGVGRLGRAGADAARCFHPNESCPAKHHVFVRQTAIMRSIMLLPDPPRRNESSTSCARLGGRPPSLRPPGAFNARA